MEVIYAILSETTIFDYQRLKQQIRMLHSHHVKKTPTAFPQPQWTMEGGQLTDQN